MGRSGEELNLNLSSDRIIEMLRGETSGAFFVVLQSFKHAHDFRALAR
jgi:hypothetical protein